MRALANAAIAWLLAFQWLAGLTAPPPWSSMPVSPVCCAVLWVWPVTARVLRSRTRTRGLQLFFWSHLTASYFYSVFSSPDMQGFEGRIVQFAHLAVLCLLLCAPSSVLDTVVAHSLDGCPEPRCCCFRVARSLRAPHAIPIPFPIPIPIPPHFTGVSHRLECWAQRVAAMGNLVTIFVRSTWALWSASIVSTEQSRELLTCDSC